MQTTANGTNVSLIAEFSSAAHLVCVRLAKQYAHNTHCVRCHLQPSPTGIENKASRGILSELDLLGTERVREREREKERERAVMVQKEGNEGHVLRLHVARHLRSLLHGGVFQELLITTYGSESEFSPSRLRFTVGLSTHLQLHAALPATRKTWSVTVSMSPRHLLLGRSRFQGHQLFLDLDVEKQCQKEESEEGTVSV